MGKSERIRPKHVADITSLSVRRVQELSAIGSIPSAAMLCGSWTYNERAIRQWVKEAEEKNASLRQNSDYWRRSRASPINPTTRYADLWSWPAASIEDALERMIRPKSRRKSKSQKI
jgi:hypothetical protein